MLITDIIIEGIPQHGKLHFHDLNNMNIIVCPALNKN
jgi:hypothetical protein